jgi:UDP-3-O-[3-hydroxymyristoyl] glucosamine N-acyltransferase
MKLLASSIYREFAGQGLLIRMMGEDREINRFAPVQICEPGDIVFVDRDEFIDIVIERGPSAVITKEDIAHRFLDMKNVPSILISPKVSLAHALVRQKYQDRRYEDEGWPEIHPSAVIHPDAVIYSEKIASNTAAAKKDSSNEESSEENDRVKIGPGAVIGKNVTIGRGSVIMANSVIEHGTIIGDYCVIYPNVTIGYDTRIGSRVYIKSGTVIGAEGFGFAQDEKRRSHRIPQTGCVVIEDDVVIGANCCIDRATYLETIIKTGVRMDNLCHIAHNVEVGEDSLLTAGFIVAGSTKIGKRLLASGQTGILDHLTIADDTLLLHRAGVTESILEGGAYAGLPLQPLKDYLKNSAVFRRLADMRKSIQHLEKAVGEPKKL